MMCFTLPWENCCLSVYMCGKLATMLRLHGICESMGQSFEPVTKCCFWVKLLMANIDLRQMHCENWNTEHDRFCSRTTEHKCGVSANCFSSPTQKWHSQPPCDHLFLKTHGQDVSELMSLVALCNKSTNHQGKRNRTQATSAGIHNASNAPFVRVPQHWPCSTTRDMMWPISYTQRWLCHFVLLQDQPKGCDNFKLVFLKLFAWCSIWLGFDLFPGLPFVSLPEILTPSSQNCCWPRLRFGLFPTLFWWTWKTTPLDQSTNWSHRDCFHQEIGFTFRSSRTPNNSGDNLFTPKYGVTKRSSSEK